MTDYTNLVKELRETAKHLDGISRFPYDDDPAKKNYSKKMADAADAIEALQAENPIVETVLVDKMRQQMEETACHCNVKENAELIAKILDDDVDRKVFEMPKRGEWIPIQIGKWRAHKCSCCGTAREVPCSSRDGIPQWKYCTECGAKMSTQSNTLNALDVLTDCGCERAKMEVQDADT